MKSIGAEFLLQDILPGVNHMRGMQYQIFQKNCILTGTQLIQLYTFVCTIPTQNSTITTHSKPPFSCLLRHTWVKAVMPF